MAWYAMHRRCYNPKCSGYINYGARGIKVCAQWSVFEIFYKDMGPSPIGTSLDRKNNNKGYYKTNCRWATRVQQENNRRNNVRITFKGRTQTLAEWSRELGINHSTLHNRSIKGLALDRKLGRWP